MADLPLEQQRLGREDSTDGRLWLRLGPDLRILELAGRWKTLCDRHGLELLHPDRLEGRAFEELLAPDHRAVWSLWLGGLFGRANESAGAPDLLPPRVPDSDVWTPWPSLRSGRVETLILALDAEAPSWLTTPLFGIAEGHLTDRPASIQALNRRARHWLAQVTKAPVETTSPLDEDALRRLAEGADPEQPRRLKVLESWRIDGLRPAVLLPPTPHDHRPFAAVSRAIRATLHDLSSPLQALRMWFEVQKLSAQRNLPAGEVPEGMIELTDQFTEAFGRLRSLVHYHDAASTPLRTILDEVVALAKSDLARRSIQVEVEGDWLFSGRRDSAMLLILCCLLGGLDIQPKTTEDGPSRATLRLTASPDRALELRCPRARPLDGATRQGLVDLATEFGWHFAAPGVDGGGEGEEPIWRLHPAGPT